MYHRFQKYLRTHFALSKAEARGTFLLSIAIMVLTLSLGFAKYKKPNIQKAPEELLVSEQTAFAALQYQAKPGDLKKNFEQAQTPESIHKTSPHSPAPFHRNTKKTDDQITYSKFDINTATAEQIRQVPGIGEILSSRIVKFRDKLGGFVSKEQYTEVYGLKPDAIERLGKDTFIHKSFEPKKVNPNTATIKSLLRHPYITYDCAKLIVRTVEHSGPFATIEEVENFLEKNNFSKKIIQYLTITTPTIDDPRVSGKA